MTLANKLPIKSFRVAKGYTQQEVAEKIGVSRNTYMKWENYESFPDGGGHLHQTAHLYFLVWRVVVVCLARIRK